MRPPLWFGLLVAACSSPPGAATDAATDAAVDADAAAQDASTDATVDTGPAPVHFGWFALVFAECTGNQPLAQCPVTAEVLLTTDAGLDGATVTFNDQPATSSTSGLYALQMPGPLAPTYHVVINVGAETRTTTLVSPDDYTLALTPATAATDAGATLTWTPSNNPLVQYAATFVTGPSITFSAHGDDTGMLTFPAGTFPSAGSYGLDFDRRVFSTDTLNVYGTPPNVELARRFTITVQ